MIKLELRNGSETLKPETLSNTSMLRKVAYRIGKAVMNLSCAIHPRDFSATILINSDNSDFTWEIISSCCGVFHAMLERAIPYPLDRSKHIDLP